MSVTVKDPNSAARSGRHVEGREVDAWWPQQTYGWAGRVQVEDKKSGGLQRSDDQVVVLGDRQSTQDEGRTGLARLVAWYEVRHGRRITHGTIARRPEVPARSGAT